MVGTRHRPFKRPNQTVMDIILKMSRNT
jgi:hypothetical protein